MNGEKFPLDRIIVFFACFVAGLAVAAYAVYPTLPTPISPSDALIGAGGWAFGVLSTILLSKRTQAPSEQVTEVPPGSTVTLPE